MVERIEDVLVVDGTGAAGFTADVTIDGDRIASVEPREGDGSGLVLAPGFVDTHTHDDFAAILHGDMGFKVQGGVTTCVVGNCGIGAAPFPVASLFAATLHPGRTLAPWDGYAGYLDRLDAEPPSVNVAALIGHGTVRGAVMGRDDGRAGRRAAGGDAGARGRGHGRRVASACRPASSTTQVAGRPPTSWSTWRRSSPTPVASTPATSATRAITCWTRSTRRSRSAGGPTCRS